MRTIANDHTWELDLLSGEPPALSLRTTFGLRARSMRLFPRFGEDRLTVTNPADFSRAPCLRAFHPNFLELDFAPLENLDLTAEFWAAGSQVIAGRYTFFNRTPRPRARSGSTCAPCSPRWMDKPSALRKSQMIHVLTGTTGGLAPLLYMTGSPVSTTVPYPTLTVELDLAPSASRQITWALAALTASGPFL